MWIKKFLIKNHIFNFFIRSIEKYSLSSVNIYLNWSFKQTQNLANTIYRKSNIHSPVIYSTLHIFTFQTESSRCSFSHPECDLMKKSNIISAQVFFVVWQHIKYLLCKHNALFCINLIWKNFCSIFLILKNMLFCKMDCAFLCWWKVHMMYMELHTVIQFSKNAVVSIQFGS